MLVENLQDFRGVSQQSLNLSLEKKINFCAILKDDEMTN